MRRTATVVSAGFVVLAAAAACTQNAALPQNPQDAPPSKEWTVVVVGENSGGKCVLMDQNRAEVRTDAKSEVGWIVIGHCAAVNGQPQTIEIDRKLKKGQEEYDPFDAGSVLKVNIPTAPGGFVLMTGNVIATIPQEKKGRYKYKIKINDQDQAIANQGDDFILCPVWPCDYD